MLIFFRNIPKILYFKSNVRLISSSFCGGWKMFETQITTTGRRSNSYETSFISYTEHYVLYKNTYLQLQLEMKRYYSKKKGSKRNVEVEEESSDEEEEYQETLDQDGFGGNIIKKSVPSLRLDSVLKAGLGVTKKKIEKDFYAGKIRINGDAILKKSFSVSIGDEIDLIKGFSPDNHKFLLVDRVIMKSVGKVSGTGNYPISMEILKALTIENYEKPWSASSIGEIEE